MICLSMQYSNAGEALDQPDGLAVLGILIRSGQHNQHFQKIARYIVSTLPQK